MKTFITYYSYSGHSDKVARLFANQMRAKGEVVLQRLNPKNETRSFIGQCREAFLRKRAELDGNTKFDAGPYDVVMIGSPVWAFAPTPAINTFLDNLSGLNGKRAVVFLTSGSGAGVGKCFGNIKKVLRDKGAVKIDEINIPDLKNKDEDFIIASLKKVL